jgi:hypothetical protein
VWRMASGFCATTHMTDFVLKDSMPCRICKPRPLRSVILTAGLAFLSGSAGRYCTGRLEERVAQQAKEVRIVLPLEQAAPYRPPEPYAEIDAQFEVYRAR